MCAQHGHLFCIKIVNINVTTKYGLIKKLKVPFSKLRQAFVRGDNPKILRLLGQVASTH